jgi:dTDP-4-amino-4,6-dideoxygalactose transaminase
MTEITPIPFFRPTLGEAEVEAAVEVLRSGWLTTGSQCVAFEAEFAEYVGAKYAVAMNSATAALHLALAARGIGPGDEVIVPTMTFASTAEVVQYMGATPVLVDVLPESMLIDPADVEAKLTERTKAIMPVHYAGFPADMDAINELAARVGAYVIDDAAHSLPTLYKGRKVGALADSTCFSFYANKTITTAGEGGMLTTNDEELAGRARRLSLHGLSRDAWRRFDTNAPWDYRILDAGFKYNLTDVAAAVGRAQLKRSNDLAAQRIDLAMQYSKLLNDVRGIRPLHDATDSSVVDAGMQHAWHLYVAVLEGPTDTVDRNGLVQHLAAASIGTSVHYRPLHMHPLYTDKWGYKPSDMPVAEDLFSRIISLPLFPGMTASDIDRVIESINGFLN